MASASKKLNLARYIKEVRGHCKDSAPNYETDGKERKDVSKEETET